MSAWGLDVIVGLQALLLGAAAGAARRVPELRHARTTAAVGAPAGGVRQLLRLPRFRQLVLVAALVLGSHAMHDAFAVIRWRAAGVSPAMVSVLWSESVAAEVLVFFLLGPALVTWLTPAGALVVAALAGLVRWAVMAQSAAVLALALVQPLHGLTFALLHLACMRLLARIVPPGLEGTAQALYGTVGIGATSAGLTLVSGVLYARVGAQGFWAMAALCALAVPLTWPLRQPARQRQRRALGGPGCGSAGARTRCICATVSATSASGHRSGRPRFGSAAVACLRRLALVCARGTRCTTRGSRRLPSTHRGLPRDRPCTGRFPHTVVRPRPSPRTVAARQWDHAPHGRPTPGGAGWRRHEQDRRRHRWAQSRQNNGAPRARRPTCRSRPYSSP